MVLKESSDCYIGVKKEFSVVLPLCQLLGHAVLSELCQQLVLVLSVSGRGPRRLPGLSGRHDLLLHLADLPPSVRGQHGGPRTV